MNNIKDRITKNINGLIMALRSKGVTQLSATKILLLINNKYNIQLDQPALEEILNQNKSVTDFDGDIITIGEPVENNDEEEVDDAVHDTAVDQAMDNMEFESRNYEKMLKLVESYPIGSKISPSSLILEENDVLYHVNNGVKKAKTNYIITDIDIKKNISESSLKCKIDGQYMIFDIPIKLIKL